MLRAGDTMPGADGLGKGLGRLGTGLGAGRRAATTGLGSGLGEALVAGLCQAVCGLIEVADAAMLPLDASTMVLALGDGLMRTAVVVAELVIAVAVASEPGR